MGCCLILFLTVRASQQRLKAPLLTVVNKVSLEGSKAGLLTRKNGCRA